MYKIYGFPTFNPIKVLLTAEELGVDYEYIALDAAAGEHKKPAHLERHPLGKFPAMEHRGKFFIESASLCRYLANTNNKRMYSSDPAEAAIIDQTMDLVAHHVGRWLGVHYWQEVVLAKMLKKEIDPEAVAEAKGWLEKHLPTIEDLANKNTFLCGDVVTIADTYTLAYFQTCEHTSANFDNFPGIVRWYEMMNSRPAADKVRALLK